MDTFQGNETKIIDVDGNDDKSNVESQYISPSNIILNVITARILLKLHICG